MFQAITTFSQELVEVTNGLLIGTHVRSAHLGKGSIHAFERVHVFDQSDLSRSILGQQ